MRRILLAVAALAGTAPASAATIAVVAPPPSWAGEAVPSVVVSGAVEETSFVSVTVTTLTRCPAGPSGFTPADAVVVTVPHAHLDMPGPFRVTTAAVPARSVPGGALRLCAYVISRERSDAGGLGLVVAAADEPLDIGIRMPFGGATGAGGARVGGGVIVDPPAPQLTLFGTRDHRLAGALVVCTQPGGAHHRQRFSLRGLQALGRTTGSFALHGAARADNSSDYDEPVPKPYRGRAVLDITGRVAPSGRPDGAWLVTGRARLRGPGLRCAPMRWSSATAGALAGAQIGRGLLP